MEEFTEFLKLCKKHLKKQPAIIKLIKKRHQESREEYLVSAAFRNSIHIARVKIESNPNEVFLYIRDFLQELKLNKDEEYERKKRKRDKFPSSDDEHPTKKVKEKEGSTANESQMQGTTSNSSSTRLVSKKLCTEASVISEKDSEPMDDIQIESLESSSEDECPKRKTVLKGEDEDFEVVLNDDFSDDSTGSVLVDYNISGIGKDLKDTCDSTVKDDQTLVTNNEGKHKEENNEQTLENNINLSAVLNKSSTSSHFSSEGCMQNSENTKSDNKMEKVSSCESIIDKSPDSTTTEPQEKQHKEGSFSARNFKDMFKKLKHLVKDNLPLSPLSTGEVLPDSSSKMEVDVCNVEETARNGEETAAEEIQLIEQTDEVDELNKNGVESRESKTNERGKETAEASSLKESKGSRLLKIIRNQCDQKVQQTKDFEKKDTWNKDCIVFKSPDYSENETSNGLCRLEGEGFHNANDSPLKIVSVISEANLEESGLKIETKKDSQRRGNDGKNVKKGFDSLSIKKDKGVERMDTNTNSSDIKSSSAESLAVKDTKMDGTGKEFKTSNTEPSDNSNKNQDIEIDISETERTRSDTELSASEKDNTDKEMKSLNEQPSKDFDTEDKTRDVKKDKSSDEPNSCDQGLSTGDQCITKPKNTSSKDKETETKSLDVEPSTSAQDESKKKKKGSKKQVERLEKLLEDIRDKIEQLKEAEVDLDDEDSAYIMEEKYQKKFVKVWNKLCEIKESSADTGRPSQRKFRYSGTRYPEINKKIEKFVNKKKCFPDYNDIRDIIVSANNSRALHLKGSAIDRLAREAFSDVGDQLQKRREEDFKYTFLGHLPRDTKIVRNEDDPAYEDKSLQLKLEENKKVSRIRLNAVIEKFVEKQDKRGVDEDDDEEEEQNEEEDAMEEDNEDVEVPEMDQIINEESQTETDTTDSDQQRKENETSSTNSSDQQRKENETSSTNSSDKMELEHSAGNPFIKQAFEVKIKEVCDIKTEEVCESKTVEVCESKTEELSKSNSEDNGSKKKIEACSIISVFEASDIVQIDDEDDDIMIVREEGFLPESIKGQAGKVKKEPDHVVKETQQTPEEMKDFIVKLQSEIFSELQSISKKYLPAVKKMPTAKRDKPQSIGKFVVDFTGEGSQGFKPRSKATHTMTPLGNSRVSNRHSATSSIAKGGKVGVRDDRVSVMSTSIRESKLPRKKIVSQSNNAEQKDIKLIPLNAIGAKLLGENAYPSAKNRGALPSAKETFGSAQMQQDGVDKKAQTSLLSKTAKYTGGSDKRLGRLTSIPHSSLLTQTTQTTSSPSQENPYSFNKYSSLISKSRDKKCFPAKTAVNVVRLDKKDDDDDDVIILD
ncbi:enolase-phosphatase E1 isoform X3 [Magallana gigas]|uniref:enolase-phosphatase E1 isoform X3 n=1 Tax=Magallana gigas TaxID=29159 RepID=UPI003342AF80